MISLECAVLVVAGGVAATAPRLRVPHAAQGMLLGAAAGALFGVSDIAIKYMTDAVEGGVFELISPWTLRRSPPR